MPTKRIQPIDIIKVPLATQSASYPQTFPRMPRLYLELFENKDKVQQDLINKEYIPRTDYASPEHDNHSVAASHDDDDDDEQIFDEEDVENTNNDEVISDRLTELLGDDSGKQFSIERSPANNTKYSRQRSIPSDQPNTAPSLSTLEQQGEYVHRKEARDINRVTHSEHEQEDMKREMLFKFDLLRKSYPAANIPTCSIHSDLSMLQRSYGDTVRRLSLDSSVESYKTYLIYGFMACEFLLGNFGGFDMQGFTQQQIVTMSSYEKLLIELGEKSYIPTGSKWPVELRLLFMIIMNAAFFIVSKMMLAKTGANILNMVNSMNSNVKPSQQPTSNDPPPKRRMKGPNIDLADIPDIS